MFKHFSPLFWITITIFLFIALGFYLLFSLKKGRNVSETIPTIIGAIVGVALAFFVSYVGYTNQQESEVDDLTERIDSAVVSLNRISNDLQELQTEIQTRIEYYDELKADVEQAEAFLEMSETNVNAITQLINNEVNRNSTRDFFVSFAQNIFFLILGCLLPVFLKKVQTKYLSKNSHS